MTGDEIKSFRETRGWNQQELAERLGVDQATVSRIERGAVPARPVALLLDRLVSDESDRVAVEGEEAAA